MKWLLSILEGIFAVFVGDTRFALAILAWVLCVWLLATRLHIGAGISGPLLAIELIAILIANAARRARK